MTDLFENMDDLTKDVAAPDALATALKESIIEAASTHYQGARLDMERYASELAIGAIAAAQSGNERLIAQIKAAPEQLAEGHKVAIARSAQSRVNTAVFTAVRIILATLPQ